MDADAVQKYLAEEIRPRLEELCDGFVMVGYVRDPAAPAGQIMRVIVANDPSGQLSKPFFVSAAWAQGQI